MKQFVIIAVNKKGPTVGLPERSIIRASSSEDDIKNQLGHPSFGFMSNTFGYEYFIKEVEMDLSDDGKPWEYTSEVPDNSIWASKKIVDYSKSYAIIEVSQDGSRKVVRISVFKDDLDRLFKQLKHAAFYSKYFIKEINVSF